MIEMLSTFKKEFRKYSRPLVMILQTLGLTPNQLSLLGFLLAVTSSIAYYIGRIDENLIPIGGLLLLFSGLSDALDGALAEEHYQTTIFGGILDSTLDRLSEAIVISSLILNGLCDPAIGLLALIASLSVSYVRSRAEVEGIEMINIGIAERAERILILVFASFFKALDIGVTLLAFISTITLVQRLVHSARAAEQIS